ncbi:DNA-binding transcriptional regulator [Shewanella sp. UCD-FRSSP16_17]|uniref:HTH-type transcriptional regulator YidZ n=1 Tax=unclassified Shewanella TaxID=196818 RepID=UPI0007EEF404|nr:MULTISPECIES: HTH-type transcriptional regulator YidZ [unclassified Shewanella]MBQ4889285.1 HTH-type transcriptional regulator YidZ [Shewanella sp. MMG014]OBT08043.1 DNA-binding transcriptional regulator [Shewanella sp. UCD-FRSSP16_17]
MKKALSRLDLNLLFTLQLLVQERSVSMAAKKLNVTPSTVSKSLNKLRYWFDDALFVKTPSGLVPTPLVESMEQELTDWLQMSSQLLGKRNEATSSNVRFDLHVESPLLLTFLNQLLIKVHQHYPNATVKTNNWDYDSFEALVSGEADIAFTGRETHPRSKESLNLLPYSIDFEVLFHDHPKVFLRNDHPALKEDWSLETFLKYSHINIVWEKSDKWALDEVLIEMGQTRTIGLTLSSFEQALYMAAQPEHQLLTTAPQYCEKYIEQLHPNLVSLPIPLAQEWLDQLVIPFTMIWHKRNAYNPKLIWLKDTLRELMKVAR